MTFASQGERREYDVARVLLGLTTCDAKIVERLIIVYVYGCCRIHCRVLRLGYPSLVLGLAVTNGTPRTSAV